MSLPPPLVAKIVQHINRKDWWHVPPQDPQAYRKRGKFLASSFLEAEFWGRPLDEPQRVMVSRPLIGDEEIIENELFGRRVSGDNISIKQRWALDARLKKAALSKGYDSIVLVTPKAFSAFKKKRQMPRSIELNVLNASSPSTG